MAQYNYQQTTMEMITKFPHIQDVYDFDRSNARQFYNDFYQFCQENLSEKCNDYNITPAYFYFTTSPDFNALASSRNIININMGVIESLAKFFMNNTSLTNYPILKKYIPLNNYLIKEKQIDFNYLMFQSFNQWIYYHELAHLIQFSNEKQTKINDFREAYLLPDISFDLKSTIMEIDADLHGANSIVFHIIQFFNNLDEKFRNEDTMFKLLSISISAMFSYFMLLTEDLKEFYIKKYDHPHPFVRITYIFTTLIDCFERNHNFKINFSSREIIKESMGISDAFFNRNYESQYLAILKDNHVSISIYIKEMIQEMEKHPYLLSNTVHKNKKI